DWAALNNALVFGSSAAFAGAVTVAAAFFVAGKSSWARSVIVAVTLATALLAALIWTCFWFDPWLIRSHMGTWEFVRLRHTMTDWLMSIVRYDIPLAAGVGLLVGPLSGRLAVFARRRPRVAIGLVLGLLFAGTLAPVHTRLFDLIVLW